MQNSFRKFQCFVCGEVIDTYPEFKDHIIKQHEEGREYLTCPLKSCQAPVRDLRHHFKAKHPKTKLPKNGQVGATVWFDINNKNKKRKPCFTEGDFISHKNGGKAMHYRSSYELQVYNCLELIGDVMSYAVEPLKIKYFYRNSERTYIPDMCINFADGRREMWEIKPENQRKLPQNKAKWTAAHHYCACRGIAFKVISEKEMKQLNEQAQGNKPLNDNRNCEPH